MLIDGPTENVDEYDGYSSFLSHPFGFGAGPKVPINIDAHDGYSSSSHIRSDPALNTINVDAHDRYSSSSHIRSDPALDRMKRRRMRRLFILFSRPFGYGAGPKETYMHTRRKENADDTPERNRPRPSSCGRWRMRRERQRREQNASGLIRLCVAGGE